MSLTGSAFNDLRFSNSIVTQIMDAGGTAEDCVVALVGLNNELMGHIIKLEAIAPRRYRLQNGNVMVWHCPDEFIPETKFFG